MGDFTKIVASVTVLQKKGSELGRERSMTNDLEVLCHKNLLPLPGDKQYRPPSKSEQP